MSGGGGGGGGGSSSSTLPVTVLVHGESYSWGAGHLMDGGLLASKSRMIVVTLNYRLGILGNTTARPIYSSSAAGASLPFFLFFTTAIIRAGRLFLSLFGIDIGFPSVVF